MTTSYYTLACEHDVKHLRFRINNYYAMQWFKYASTVCKSFPNGDDCCRVYVSSLTVWCDDKVLNSQLSLVNTLYGVVRRKCSAQLLDLLTFYYHLCNSEHLAFYVICTVDVVVSRAVNSLWTWWSDIFRDIAHWKPEAILYNSMFSESPRIYWCLV